MLCLLKLSNSCEPVICKNSAADVTCFSLFFYSLFNVNELNTNFSNSDKYTNKNRQNGAYQK